MAAITKRRDFIVGMLDRWTSGLRPPWLHFVAVLALGLVPALSFSWLSSVVGEPLGPGARDVLGKLLERTGAAMLLAIVLVPLVETGLLWAVVHATRKLARSSDVAVITAAVVLALMHHPAAPGRALTTAWPFLVWGAVLLSARFRQPWAPFVTVWALHAAHNAIALSIMYSVA